MNLTLISEIPSFFNDQLGFNLQSSGLLGILPFFTLFVATVASGMIFEYCQEVLGWKTRTVRQVAEYIAFGASSLVLIGCGFVQDRPYLAYFLMVLSQVSSFHPSKVSLTVMIFLSLVVLWCLTMWYHLLL